MSDDRSTSAAVRACAMTKPIYLNGFHASDGIGCTSLDCPHISQQLVDTHWDATTVISGIHHRIETGQESAILLVGDELCFQLGNSRWNWHRDRVKISYQVRWLRRMMVYLRIGKRPFADVSVRIYCKGRCVYRSVYESALAFHVSIGDMAFGDSDLEMEEWWLYLCRVQNDKYVRDALVIQWKGESKE